MLPFTVFAYVLDVSFFWRDRSCLCKTGPGPLSIRHEECCGGGGGEVSTCSGVCSSAHCTSSSHQSLGSRTGRHTATPCPDTRTQTTNPRPPRKTRNVFVKFALAGKFEAIASKNNILPIILEAHDRSVIYSTDNRSICRYLWATFLSMNIISAGMRLLSPRPWPLTPDSHLSWHISAVTVTVRLWPAVLCSSVPGWWWWWQDDAGCCLCHVCTQEATPARQHTKYMCSVPVLHIIT